MPIREGIVSPNTPLIGADGMESISLSGTSQGLSAIPAGASGAILSANGGDANIGFNGEPAVAGAGFKLPDGAFITVTNRSFLNQLRAIGAGRLVAIYLQNAQ